MLFSLEGTLLFPATRSDLGRELWKWDALNGVSLVKDIAAGAGSGLHSLTLSHTRQWAVAGGWVYFVATQGFTGGGISELWKSDGTADGTVLMKDIRPGTSGSFPEQLTAVGDEVYFTADNGTNGRELWKSDGTEAGTFLVYETLSGDVERPLNLLTGAGGRLYFSVPVEGIGDELWTVNESFQPMLVGDVTGDGGGSNPGAPVVLGERLFFAATDRTVGRELWTVNLSDPIALAGDFDGDGDADGGDFLTWQGQLGTPVDPVGSGADGNSGGNIESGDLAVWKSNFGRLPLSNGSPTITAVGSSAMLADVALAELTAAWHMSRQTKEAYWLQSPDDDDVQNENSSWPETSQQRNAAFRLFDAPATDSLPQRMNIRTRNADAGRQSPGSGLESSLSTAIPNDEADS
jgi:ELWxxDGT repeat protein